MPRRLSAPAALAFSALALAFSALVLTFLITLAAPSALAAGAPSEAAARLRNAGLALLENEKPAEAEEVYRRLVAAAPQDPLSHANLAVALLRQQKTDDALAAVDRALELAPGRADLLSIRGEILSWVGDTEGAVTVLRRAMAAAPDDPEIAYQLYRTAATAGGGEAAETAMAEALERLRKLRPENVVVMLESGRRAIAAGDRSAASGAYLRLKELLWQAPNDVAGRLMQDILAALEGGDVAAARVPAQRLENVLKVSAMYQQSLREVWSGITGVPVKRFAGEPPPADFGNPVRVSFQGSEMDAAPSLGAALAVADFDGDQRPDVARLVSVDGKARLEVRLAAKAWAAGATLAVPALGSGDGAPRLLVVDLDNDGQRDLFAYGRRAATLLRGGGDGSFTDAGADFGLAQAAAGAAAVLDFDVEGDLDLATAAPAGSALELYRNSLAGALEAVGGRVLPKLPASVGDATDLVASDLDRDGDVDLLRLSASALHWLDNLRQGRFTERSKDGGLAGLGGGRAAVSADLDNDGYPDLAVAGGAEPLALLRNRGGRFAAWDAVVPLPAGVAYGALVAFDADNDGRLDLAVAGKGGGGDSAAPALAVLGQRADSRFAPIRVAGAPAAVADLAAADLDGDGDLDLVAAGPDGLHRFENRGGDANKWLSVHLRGLAQGSSKNNVLGVGSVVEVRDGYAYQFREADGGPVHFGLGKRESADALRVEWTNGVPQDRRDVAADQSVVEEQLLKGSCPFLYTWDGERMAFVTDLLWGAPIGLPVAEGVWAGADPSELVRVDGARDDAGVYRLRVTEELWEAAFFDQVKLWLVDHPADVEVASSLRVVPGRQIPEAVMATRGLRPVAAATLGALGTVGEDVTARLRQRDDVYADAFAPSRWQGIAAKTWALTFDLGEAPAAPLRLSLDGWIFPTDASLNLALDQRSDVGPEAPRLEVETADGWQVLVPASDLGFPAGKTKTMVVDTPPLPPGAHRLRLVSNLWLGWDRVAWTLRPQDGTAHDATADDATADSARVVARLLPRRAELRYRGFSALVRRAPNAPHGYDYARTSIESPWLPFAGRYTRYGDVSELLETADDRSVILAPGDEIAIEFDASALPAPPDGWQRTVFLESHGWDKDADRNTYEPRHLEPLPFHAMTGYPYGPGEHFPDDPLHREYLEQWLTRVVEPAPVGVGGGGVPAR